MDRYHSPIGTGTGLPLDDKNLKRLQVKLPTFRLNGQDDVMYEAPESGFWVLFEDALKRSRQEFDKGKAEGLKEGAAKGAGILASSLTCEVCHEAGVALGRLNAEAKSKDAILTAYQDGLKVGRAQGQTKLDAYIALDRWPVYKTHIDSLKRDIDDLHTARAADRLIEKELRAALKQYEDKADAVTTSIYDTRTNQLLNELYHDRARLEQIVEDSCEVVVYMGDYLEDKLSIPHADGHKSQKAWLLGVIDQFFDTHATDEQKATEEARNQESDDE